MRKVSAFIAALAVLAALSTAAQARTVEYLSQHPVPHKFGGGFCYIDVPHVHNYPPGDPRMYRENNGQYYFVGDPAPFDYDGPRYSYYGAHPVVDAEVRFGHPVYCYIKGPHYHWYQPPVQSQFEMKGGAYWYVGAFPPAYYDDRPRYQAINEAYAPMPYARPVVDVEVAPVAVRAEISFGGPGWRASALVGGPPAPVFVPPPVQVGVGINLGGGPPGVVERREIYQEQYHHDHGRHEGWREHEHGRRDEGWRAGEHPRYDDRPRHGQPSRFIAGPAPVREPLLRPGRGPGQGPRIAQPQHGAAAPSAPMRGPATAPMRGPAQQAPRMQPVAPQRGPAPAQGRQGRNDNRQNHRN